MKKLLLSLILLLPLASFSQSVNDYQYVIVPVKFDFLKENDQYRLNTTTKLLLQKYGFKAFLRSEELPKEVDENRCNVLYATVESGGGMLMTKLKVVLKDCHEKVLFETDFGTSRIKEYAPAYNEAIRNTNQSFEKLNYKYSGNPILVETVIPAVPETPAAKVTEPNPNALASANSEIFFFAQPITNGFQVVNSEPRVIMHLFNTSQKNVYIGIRGDLHGVIITKNGKWAFEYYENSKLVSEPINLRF